MTVRLTIIGGLYLALLLCGFGPCQAQGTNLEDLPIADDIVPAQPAATRARPAPLGPMTVQAQPAPEDFMREALYAGLIVALMCSYLGIYIVLRRMVFIGVALAEVSSAGIALALWVGFSAVLGALAFMLLGVVLASIHWSRRRVPHESYTGVLYALASALGILFVAKNPLGESHMLHLLHGDVLTVVPSETRIMGGVFIVVAILHILFGKEFLLVSFDRDAAATLGLRAGAWDLLLFLTLGIVIALSIHAVGALITTTLLIIPAATALLLVRRLRPAMLLAPILGAVAVALGLRLSLVQDLPPSALIVVVSCGLLMVALACYRIRRIA